MREIKFRAWDKERKQMRYQDKEFFRVGLRHNKIGNEFWKDLTMSVDNFYTPEQGELQQYTGFKDKHGVEIYEGDILLIPDEWTERILDDGSGPRESINHLAPVIFKDGSFGVDIPDMADIYKKGFWAFPVIEYRIGDHPEEWEIIGNIYESSELLK